jgi:MFS family permease
LKTPSLVSFLKNLSGNPRGCVYPEPLWGIPFNLYSPYASIYMVAIGLVDTQIGLIVSISWAAQLFFALFSGVITDKLGRRMTTLAFDILAWAVPAFISAIAQNFWFFLAAGVVNSVWRVTQNSWTCLLVEDANPDEIVDIYTWIYIANQISGFVAPLAGLIISRYSLIPTVRGLYFMAAIMFTLKAIVTYQMTEETEQGKIRLHETRHESMLVVLQGYKDVFIELIHTPQTLYTAGIMLTVSIAYMIINSFWPILLTEKLMVPAAYLSIFPFIKSAVILFFLFTVLPIIKRMHYKIPLVVGFLTYVISQSLLIFSPPQNYYFIVLSVVLEACSFATVVPLLDQMMVLTINVQERARIQSIMYVGIILLTAPFGWIAGSLSQVNKTWPFILTILLFSTGAFLAARAGKLNQKNANSLP